MTQPVNVGDAVVVRFYDGSHNGHSVIAHALGISPATEEDVPPSLTLAFPDPNCDPAVLRSASWYQGYTRRMGVPHFSSSDVTEGRQLIAWAPLDSATELSVPQPEGDGSKPYLGRGVPETPAPQIVEMAAAVQSGKVPESSVISRLPSGVDPAVPDLPPDTDGAVSHAGDSGDGSEVVPPAEGATYRASTN
jgi:hypothetical protein